MADARDDKILHQADHEEVIEENVAENFETNLGLVSDDAAIANLAAPSAGYVEAEALAARDKINAILSVLREANLIPT